jgi:hypothetical protein
MLKPKPHLVAAVLCEKVLQEADGVLSAIRIVDKVIFEVPKGAPSNYVPAIELTTEKLLGQAACQTPRV